jgi:hypothetical protein
LIIFEEILGGSTNWNTSRKSNILDQKSQRQNIKIWVKKNPRLPPPTFDLFFGLLSFDMYQTNLKCFLPTLKTFE